MYKSEIEKKWSRVAIVVDQMTQFGGADRVLYSMLKLLPNADIYTILLNKEVHKGIKQNIYTSFVQRIPAPKSFYRHLKIFTPIAYESFDLRGYDLVISVSAGPAKGVITGITQPHIAITLTPPRGLWDLELNVRASHFKNFYKPLSILLNNYMRIWDYSISKRVDYWISISKFISKKVRKTYGVNSDILYLGIEEDCFREVSKKREAELRKKYDIQGKFFLVVSRLYDYKQVDLAIRACMKENKQLIVIGDGPDMSYLKRIANGNTNIKFLGSSRDDSEIRAFYHMAEALLFCGIEDFGLVPIESMAQATPVIAYNQGGLLETVVDHVTGEFFKSEEKLAEILKKFDKKRYNAEAIIKQAKKFTEKKFLENLEIFLNKIYENQKSKHQV